MRISFGTIFRAMLLVALLQPAIAMADSTGSVPTLEEVLARFSEARASTETLQAHFEERKDLALLKEPVIQGGTFYHSKPARFFWEYETPTEKQILLTSEVLLAYYPDLKKAEEVNVRRWTSRIRRYLGVGEDPEVLRRDYDISLVPADDNDFRGTDLLVLVPRTKKMKKRLQELRIWLDARSGQTRRISYLDANGDRTTFTFSQIQVNLEIDESRFEIELPRDVKMGGSFTAFSG